MPIPVVLYKIVDYRALSCSICAGNAEYHILIIKLIFLLRLLLTEAVQVIALLYKRAGNLLRSARIFIMDKNPTYEKYNRYAHYFTQHLVTSHL
jgi:hypothetical protein